MTHQIRLPDLLLIRRLQKMGLQLDLYGSVLSPTSPLMAALRGILLPGYGNRIATTVVDDHAGEHYLHGFVQARDRAGAPEQDITFVAPRLSSGNGVIWTWQRLLNQICALGREHGIQRIFVQIGEEQLAEIEVFRQAGFSIYAKDQVFHLQNANALPQATGGATNLQWREMRPPDLWELQKLNNLITPAIVQHAEGTLAGTISQERQETLTASTTSNVVLVSDTQEILGRLSLRRGRRGDWLKIIMHPNVCGQADIVLPQGIAALGTIRPALPLYCDVREYEGYVAGALERMGFQPLVSRALMVKSMTVPIREPRRVLVPHLERQAEQIPTASTSGQ
ncbi:MAG: hypothetical protein GXP41_09230 [Chloroflexi bacterium]|nr:hypothetical protein [Chloroflexota bacterium]